MKESDQDDFIARQDAQGYWDAISGEVLANPHVHIWEVVNEPSIWIKRVRDGFEKFTQDLIQIFHAYGLRVLVGNINVGHPDLKDEGLMHIIGRAIQGADGFGLHEYNWPNLWDGDDPGVPGEQGMWYTLRYRRTVGWLTEHGYKVPPVYITEVGIDRAAKIDGPHQGWVGHLTVEQYARQIAWYESEVMRDHYVVAAFLFVAGPYQDWESFRITEELMRMVMDLLPQIDTRARGTFLSKYQKGIDYDRLRREHDYVIIRASSGIEKDPLFETHWRETDGMPRGAYHGLHADVDVLEQADVFASAVAGKRPELEYWADLEIGALTGDMCMDFLHEADVLVGSLVGVYTNLNFAKRLPPEVGERRLWLAAWTGDPGVAPDVPPQWDCWTFWQWSGSKPFGNVRLCPDLYRGTKGDLCRDFQCTEGDGDMKIFDANGVERDMAWVHEKYGDVQVHITEVVDPDIETFRVAELRERIGPATMTVTLLDESGAPLAGRAVIEGWRDGEEIPEDVLPAGGLPEGYPARGLGVFTDTKGNAEWAWGGGEYYNPAEVEGPHWFYVTSSNSDVVTGLGMLPNTEHAHLDITFRRSTGSEPPGPVPGPEGEIRVAIIGTLKIDSVMLLTEEVEDCLGV